MSRLSYLPLAIAIATPLLAPDPAGATSIAERTLRVSMPSNDAHPNGTSTRPSVNDDGSFVAFDSVASNLAPDPNGPVRDVFLHEVGRTGQHMVSTAADGGGANGPSHSAVLSSRGGLVAYVSDATNLVEGDANGLADVFVKIPFGPNLLVSSPTAGGSADGASRDPDISADGTRIVFSSTATNLVPGDGNRLEDVFVRDLVAGTLERVSQPLAGDANGASRAPSISPDGRYVAFHSRATNLVNGDTNKVADVFLVDLEDGDVERVSVSSRGRQQNKSVLKPFTQVSDVSENGRYVVFDSDATNLVRGDTNRDTDVFVRDRRRKRTERVTVDVYGVQGDNDSFAPRMSPDGRFITFESFASNLFPRDRRREDVFLHDRRVGLTTIITVTSQGRLRGPERGRQLLQRPALSDDGRVVAFSSTATLTLLDGNDAEDVFVRLTAPPRGRFASTSRSGRRISYRMRTDDAAAKVFACSLNNGIRGWCPRRWQLPAVTGPHRRQVLRVWSGGPGMLFDSTPARKRFLLPR